MIFGFGKGDGEEAATGSSRGGAGTITEAERRASAIVQQANEGARKQVDDAREGANGAAAGRLREMDELTDGLVERARAVSEQAETVIEALDDAIARLGGSRARAALKRVPALGEATMSRAGETVSPGRGASAEPSEGARLLAAQMAASGADRAEIEQRLREGFGIENADEVVDRVLGGDD